MKFLLPVALTVLGVFQYFTSSADTLYLTAIGSGGSSFLSGNSYAISFTLGLATAGISNGPSDHLFAGFWFADEAVSGVPAVDADAGAVTRLLQNYPNPFNPRTTITFTVGTAAGVSAPASFQVFNVEGQLVRTLLSGAVSSGRYELQWDGRDDSGIAVPSGVYLGRLIVANDRRSMRLLAVK